jgi:hypothetical protein
MNFTAEAQRQQALLQALCATQPTVQALSLRQTGPRALRGLTAYRANAEVLADRALTAVFGSVRTMVGAEAFKHLARDFWRAHPPQQGDLGEWGVIFPTWLADRADAAPWPYLGDCARLDLAVHQNERAADAELDAASLMQLESIDPAQLVLHLMPGTALLRSSWPIASIYAAHQLNAEQAGPAFEAVRAALAAHQSEQVLVARSGWRAVVYPITPAVADWAHSILSGASVADALMRAGPAFDFADWLRTALQASWLQGVVIKPLR